MLSLCCCCAAARAQAGAQRRLAVEVNGRAISDNALILMARDERLLMAAPLFALARLRLPGTAAAAFDELDYYAPEAISGALVSIDAASQTLRIVAPAGAFVTSEFGRDGAPAQALDTADTGGFLNYDLRQARSRAGHSVSGLAELGVFGAAGTFTSRFVGTGGVASSQRGVFRLDSQLRRDFAAEQASLIIGDSVSVSTVLARQVNFGGVQWRTKFATTPGFRSMPLPALSGTAATPSVVDLYVNNQLSMSQAVDTGPFAINNLPLVSGQGSMRMVVRDVLGRQQLYDQNYLVSGDLLRQGISDVSYEAGALHIDYGSPGQFYGPMFGSASMRHGVSDSLTLSSDVTWLRGQQAGGVGATWALPVLGLLSAGVALSRTAAGTASARYLQFDRQHQRLSWSLRAQGAAERYAQFGTGAPARQLQGRASVALGERLNLSLGYLAQAYRQQSNLSMLNAALNLNSRSAGSLTLAVMTSPGHLHGWSASLVWVMPLAGRDALQVLATRQYDTSTLSAEYQHVGPVEGGWSYRAHSARGAYAGEGAGASYLGEAGEVMVEGNRLGQGGNLQFGVRGGIVAMGHHVRATRWLDDSFALLEVPVAQVFEVYANNVLIGKTDADGVALVPRLVPYERNTVALGSAGVPLSVAMDLTEKTLFPAPRSGVLIKFAAHISQGATLTLHDAHGQPLPPGTKVQLNGARVASEVAMRGRAFVAEIAYPARVAVRDARGVLLCQFAITDTPLGAFPTLGPYVCASELP